MSYCFKADSFLKGNLGRDVVKAMLGESGYTVCLYGWEETMLDAKSKYTYEKWRSMTGRRLTSSPDLLVYDDKDIMMLVEVKTRGKSRRVKAGEVWIQRDELKPLQDFWNDSILAVVVPEGNVFYAQKISELEIQQNELYPLTCFAEFQEIFTKVQPMCISHFKDIALQILQVFNTKKETSE